MTGKVNTIDRFDVLVVEDNPDDSELTINAVKRGSRNANIIHCWNGREALQYLDLASDHLAEPVRLILLDPGLPGMNGLDLLRKVRSDNHTRSIPVVILSASEEIDSISEAYRLGVNSYVIKPSRFEAYMEKVSSLASYWTMVNAWEL